MAIRMNREYFCNYIGNIRKFLDFANLVYEKSYIDIIEGPIRDIVDDHIPILAEALLNDGFYKRDIINDLTELLFWFCYELEFGDKVEIIRCNNRDYVINSVDALYNYLNDVY